MAWDGCFHRAERCPKKAPIEVHIQTLQVCSVHGSHVLLTASRSKLYNMYEDCADSLAHFKKLRVHYIIRVV